MMNKLLKDPARLQHAVQLSREEQKQPFHCGVNRCCHDGVTHCFICMMPTYQVSFNPHVLTEQPVTACKQYPAAILLMLVMTHPHSTEMTHVTSVLQQLMGVTPCSTGKLHRVTQLAASHTPKSSQARPLSHPAGLWMRYATKSQCRQVTRASAPDSVLAVWPHNGGWRHKCWPLSRSCYRILGQHNK